jgi:SAM-dependent methyltransferase
MQRTLFSGSLPAAFYFFIQSLPYRFTGKGNRGYCPVCERETVFIRFNPWLRDHYKCMHCQSIPRQRALINTLNIFYPGWPDAMIHESSPSGVSSEHIGKKCKNYSYSYFFPDTEPGSSKNGARCENLEKMTFEDARFDLVITQDVFEHVNYPDWAFREIARVLKPGGMHIFTIPLYRELKQTRPRIAIQEGNIQNLLEPIYHGNPIDSNGSLVTIDYGLDFVDFVYASSGMATTIYLQKDLHLGLDAEFLEVFISRKPLTDKK